MKKILLIDDSDFFSKELISFFANNSVYCLRCNDYQSALNEQRNSLVSAVIIKFFSNTTTYEFINNSRYANPYGIIIVCSDYFSKDDLIVLKKNGH